MDSDKYNDMLNPYGLNTPPSPISDLVVRIMQGDKITLVRAVCNFNGDPARPDNCELVFTIVDKRYETADIYRADWIRGITPMAGGRVAIEVSSVETSKFRRGSLLYSLTIYDKLKTTRQVLEEGSIFVEYPADAPYPSVPYNSSNRPEDAHV